MYQANQRKVQRSIKRLVLAVMLVLACLVLSGCYTDPDRAFDGDPNLNLNPSSTFETVVTNTPVVTNSPTPSPEPIATETPLPEATQGSVDWNDFQWGNTVQPDQPTNVVTSAPSSSGIIGNGGSSVITQNITPTNPPQNVQTDPGQTNTGIGGSSNSGSTPIVNNGGSSSGSTPIVNNGGSSSSNNGGSSSNNGGSSSSSGGSSSSNNGSSSSNNGSSSSSNNGGSSSSSGGSSSSSSTTLKMGSKGEEVKRLQDRLKELKYYTGSSDGDYGQGTYNAVKEFQKNNNLGADGVAGKKTLEAVYSYYAVPKTSTGSGNGGGGSSSNGSSSGSSSSGSSSKPSSGSSSSGSSSSGSSSSGSSSSNANSYTNGETNTYLKSGSSGAQVKIMQNRLIVLGYLSGTANGKFETTTEEAVKAFQKRHNMYADGIAGPDTLTKLYSSSAKKADSVVANLGSLKEGDNGPGVRALQRNLRTLGYYTGSVDGDYGAGTLAAVTAFQNANGLTADGIAGNSTQGAILVAINGGSTGGGAGSGSGSGSGNNGSTNPVTYGSTATSNGYSTVSSTNGNTANISAVQSALKAKGYYSGSLDGNYGSGTEKAVEEFQRAQGLRVTGMAGPTTQRLLYGGTAADGSYKKLELGSSGTNVKNLQYALYELKYYDGNITGKYDDATESAVMLFQDCNGLEIDGVAGQMTQRLLFSSSAKPCTK